MAAQAQVQGVIDRAVDVLAQVVKLPGELAALVQVVEVGDTLPQRQTHLVLVQGALEQYRQQFDRSGRRLQAGLLQRQQVLFVVLDQASQARMQAVKRRIVRRQNQCVRRQDIEKPVVGGQPLLERVGLRLARP